MLATSKSQHKLGTGPVMNAEYEAHYSVINSDNIENSDGGTK